MKEYLLTLKLIVLSVCLAALAGAVIRLGLRRAAARAGGDVIRVVQKVPLDARGDRQLIVVQMGAKMLLLGSAQGSISLLLEMPCGELPPPGGAAEPGEKSLSLYRRPADFAKTGSCEKEEIGP